MITKNEIQIKFNTIRRYFDNTTSDKENILVNEWLRDTKNYSKFESYLRPIWNELDRNVHESSFDLEARLNKIHHVNILARKGENDRSLPGRNISVVSFNLVFRNLVRIAVILLLPVLTFIGWEIYKQKMWTSNQNEIIYNEIFCPLGARSQFILPDGTIGSLNNESRLKYPVKFYGSTREVELVGDAYFDVSCKDKPFIINRMEWMLKCWERN